jgi:hypothetical protein
MDNFEPKLFSNQATARYLLHTAEEYVACAHAPMLYAAEVLLRRAIHYDPLLLHCYHLLGFVLEQQGHWDDAIEVFNTIKQIHRWRAQAHKLTRNAVLLPVSDPDVTELTRQRTTLPENDTDFSFRL